MTTIAKKLRALARDATEAASQPCEHEEAPRLCSHCATTAVHQALQHAARAVSVEYESGAGARVKVDLE